MDRYCCGCKYYVDDVWCSNRKLNDKFGVPKDKIKSALWIKTQTMECDCEEYEFNENHTSFNEKCENCSCYKNNRCTNRDGTINPDDLLPY